MSEVKQDLNLQFRFVISIELQTSLVNKCVVKHKIDGYGCYYILSVNNNLLS